MMMRTFFALEHVDVGFNPMNILHARLILPRRYYRTPQQHQILIERVLHFIRALPGVSAASVSFDIPPYGGGTTEVVVPEKIALAPPEAMFSLCSADYFKTLELPLIRGRLFSDADLSSARLVAVINRALARAFFGSGDPIGRRIKFTLLDRWPAPHDAYFEIIGVVRNARNTGPRNEPVPEAFIPYTIVPSAPYNVLVRTSVGAPLLPSVQQAVWKADPNVTLTGSESIGTLLQNSAYAQPRFALLTLGAFAGIGLVLVVIGIFSVIAYSVSLRTREIGIRMALGADRGNVLKLVVRQGFKLTLLGVGIGIAGALALTRFLSSLLYGVKPADPVTFIAVALLLATVALVASYIPARRAASVDPMVALRYE
jgi:putative ABC transport system permease protein